MQEKIIAELREELIQSGYDDETSLRLARKYYRPDLTIAQMYAMSVGFYIYGVN